MRANRRDDEECERLVRLGEALWDLATMAVPGRPDAYRKKMEAPLVGDTVVVRHVRGAAKYRDRVGTLIDASDYWSAPDGYAEPLQGSGTTWTIRTPRGVVQKWTNVHVIQIERLPQ